MASTYTPIATTTLSSTSASVSFTSVPSTYTDLVLIVSAKSNAGIANVTLQYNGDTATNYSDTYLYGDGTTAGSGRDASKTTAFISSVDGTNYSATTINIQNYANSTTYKTAISKGGTGSSYAIAYVGLWRSTAAINRVDVLCSGASFVSGSTFTLYGIKAA